MYFLRRTCMYILLILLFISIYNDLTFGTPFQIKEESPKITNSSDAENANAILVEVQPGDTLLSKVEQLNEDLPINLDISQIISDFKKLNPSVDPHKLQTNTSYLFPVYKNN